MKGSSAAHTKLVHDILAELGALPGVVIGANASGARPNSPRKTSPYSSTPTPPAFSSVPSTSHSTRRSDPATTDIVNQACPPHVNLTAASDPRP